MYLLHGLRWKDVDSSLALPFVGELHSLLLPLRQLPALVERGFLSPVQTLSPTLLSPGSLRHRFLGSAVKFRED